MLSQMTDKEKYTKWEKRFLETADLLPGIICEGDATFKVTYANEFAFKALKYTPQDLEDGMYFHTIIHPDDKERAIANVQKLLSGNTIGPQEYRLIHKDGSFSDYQINSSPILEGDVIVGIRTCIFDVSERKRAMAELKAGEERFRMIFQESPIGLALFDEKGRLIEGNQAFAGLFEIDFETALGPTGQGETANLFNLLSLDSEEILSSMTENVFRCNREFTTESSKYPTDSRNRFYEWTVSGIEPRQGAKRWYLAQVQDATERKAAETARIKEAESAAQRAEALVRSLRQEVHKSFTFNDMVSRSPEMKKVFDILPQIATAPTTVLIMGESGTGKELIAKALHQMSPRKRKPFVAVNCSALPDNLLESELFGYKAGAFTDAKKDKPGKFAIAEGGVLFLDEIGDMSLTVQVKLLRVLQEKTYEPLGGVDSIKSDVRIVAATHRNLDAMVKEGTFREDLFYRINVLKIKLIPLRERRMDIPILVDHFIERFNARYDKKIESISHDALDLLMSHDFNGNIRELENIVEHAFVFCTEKEIRVMHLPEDIRGKLDEEKAHVLRDVGSYEELEASYLRAILAETGGSRIEAAKRLNIHKSTLFRKMKKLNVNG